MSYQFLKTYDAGGAAGSPSTARPERARHPDHGGAQRRPCPRSRHAKGALRPGDHGEGRPRRSRPASRWPTTPRQGRSENDRGVPPDLPQPRQPRHPDRLPAVKGAALGGGLRGRALLRHGVAADNLKIGQPEMKLGVFRARGREMLPRGDPEKKAFRAPVRRRDHPVRRGPGPGPGEQRSFIASFAEEFASAWPSSPGSRAPPCGPPSARSARPRASLRRRPGARERLYLDELMKTTTPRRAWRVLEKRPPCGGTARVHGGSTRSAVDLWRARRRLPCRFAREEFVS